MAPIPPGHWASHISICGALLLQRAAWLSDQGCCNSLLSGMWARGHGGETGCIQELQMVSPSRCLIGSILPGPGCLEDGWSWGKNASLLRNSCVGFLLLSVITYVRGDFASLPAGMQVFPASFVFSNEPAALLGSHSVSKAEGPGVDASGEAYTGKGALECVGIHFYYC